MKTVFEDSVRSTESWAHSLLFIGFLFPLRPPRKPPFPMVFSCLWFTLDEGKRDLPTLSTTYENIMLVFLAAKDDCIFTVKILHSFVGSWYSPRFKKFCSFVWDVTFVSPDYKILWWLHPFDCLFLMTRSLYLTYREIPLRP
ncbi:hypothetical protein V6N12_035796 [Hibiscus sabdariffa]|uniref:Uncharacterized protein n=1 Tax=Hibiscus sabdariffa TaxID=183260 RepID=A0ABR2ENT1_9ROSI